MNSSGTSTNQSEKQSSHFREVVGKDQVDAKISFLMNRMCTQIEDNYELMVENEFQD